jgi:hypothetical protein
MSSLKHYYGGSFVFTAVAALLGFLLGGWAGMGIVLILGVMETSLSFDNAVVNSTVLRNWDAEWRHRFLTWGMPVAVFGMRLVLPLVIVAVIGMLNPIEAVKLAFQNPHEYARLLTSAHNEIAAFGGAYLFMIALKFFLDSDKDNNWISFIETPLVALGSSLKTEIAIPTIVAVVVGATAYLLGSISFLVAGLAGIIAYVGFDYLGGLVQNEDGGAPADFVKQGLAGFFYLELLDASFSFDGVMGAFALSTNILVIALGLGTGAMFVRSMTIHLVDKGVLDEFKFLENGAFYAIGTLASLMFVGAFIEIPEIITGLIGASFIGVALLSSILYNRKHANDSVPA